MEEQFELPLVYKGEHLLLKASLLVTGYTHKFMVEVDGQTIIFEPDEERNYRAVISYDDIGKNKPIDIELLKASNGGDSSISYYDMAEDSEQITDDNDDLVILN